MKNKTLKKNILKLGKVSIEGYAALAPMAGVTDRAFREICKEFGASYVVSEMVSSKAVSFLDKKTDSLLLISKNEHPAAIQIFGDNPLVMANAAKYSMRFSPDMIDINMGCPAPKVSKNGCGAALMKNPELCFKIIDAVKNSVYIPVTVKIRKGWDSQSVNAVEIAKLCEKAGADAIIVHGRTREQMYSLDADWSIIEKVKKAVNIPVIGNGDITSADDAFSKMSDSKCDMVMIGRGALGNPWIFSQINHDTHHEINIYDKVNVMCKHIKLLCKYKGEVQGMKEARKHVAWYLKNLRCAAEFRKKSTQLKTFDDLLKLKNEVILKNS